MRGYEFLIEQNTITNHTVYLDMDGVLADFTNKYIELFGTEPDVSAKNDPNLTKMVGTNFFDTLDKLPNADRLIRAVVRLFGSYSICSSPLRDDQKNSEENKRKWIQRHLTPQPKSIVITGKKDSYAKGGNILIDDRLKNISAWNDRGGIGILYDAYTDDVDEVIKKLMYIKDQM